MKNKLIAIIISLVIIAIVGGGIYFLAFPESEYKDVNWSDYEHTDAYDYHYYLELEDKEKIAYENILSEYATFPEKVEIPMLTEAELTKVYTALLYDNPLLFCFDRTCNILTSGKKTYFRPTYIMSKTEYEAKLAEIRALTPEILKSLPSNEFDVELYLHDYIIDRCTYSDTEAKAETTLYGALIDGKASCEGYSFAMKYLADLCQIDCYVLFGAAESESEEKGNHMWNIITIDGEKYHLDVTWNDTVAEDDASDEHRYMYFNVTDEEISNTHSDFEIEDKCTATAANYYIRHNLNFDAFGESEKKSYAKIIADAANNGYSSLGIRFATDELFGKAEKELLREQKIFLILAEADRLTSKKIKTDKFRYRLVDDVKVLEIMFSVV